MGNTGITIAWFWISNLYLSIKQTNHLSHFLFKVFGFVILTFCSSIFSDIWSKCEVFALTYCIYSNIRFLDSMFAGSSFFVRRHHFSTIWSFVLILLNTLLTIRFITCLVIFKINWLHAFEVHVKLLFEGFCLSRLF